MIEIMITYILNIFSDFPPPKVTISGPITARAGEDLVLTCIVEVIEHLTSVPSVEWSGGSVGSGNDVIEGNTTHNGNISEKTLTFSPLHTSHGSLYTCTANINIQSINLGRTGTKSTAIQVACKQFSGIIQKQAFYIYM